MVVWCCNTGCGNFTLSVTLKPNAMKTMTMILMISFLGIFTSCEKECLECPPCEEPPECELTDWGLHVKNDLISLFLDVKDLALCQVWSADGQTRFWSGYGSNGKDSREVLYDFLNLELVLTFRQFVNGKWNSGLIQVPYEQVIMTVLQYATHMENGMVVRRANNILIYVSDQFDPALSTDGVDAVCIPPSCLQVSHEKLILKKESAPTS